MLTQSIKFLAASLLLSLALVSTSGYAADDTDTVTVTHVWARATPPGINYTAAYFTVESKISDRLIGISSSEAEKGEMHTTDKSGPTVEMRPATSLAIEPGKPLVLKPSETHVMLMGLKHPLNEGDKLPLILNFEKAGSHQVSADIRPLHPHAGDTMEDMPMMPMGSGMNSDHKGSQQ